jgi:enoyl-CoA hydratase/carnithine racemase
VELKLEDLTKDELIRLIRKYAWINASRRDMFFIRWETLSEKGQALLGESIKAGEAGDWKLADKLYDESARVHKKADAFYAAGMMQG